MVIHLAVKLFVPGIDKNGEITMAYIKNKKGQFNLKQAHYHPYAYVLGPNDP